MIPYSIHSSHVGLGLWAAEQVGQWNGVGRMKFGTGAAPLTVGMPGSEGAILVKRAKAWASRLQAGMIDQEEGIFLIGGDPSPADSEDGVYLGVSPSLGRPGAARGEPGSRETSGRWGMTMQGISFAGLAITRKARVPAGRSILAWGLILMAHTTEAVKRGAAKNYYHVLLPRGGVPKTAGGVYVPAGYGIFSTWGFATAHGAIGISMVSQQGHGTLEQARETLLAYMTQHMYGALPSPHMTIQPDVWYALDHSIIETVGNGAEGASSAPAGASEAAASSQNEHAATPALRERRGQGEEDEEEGEGEAEDEAVIEPDEEAGD